MAEPKLRSASEPIEKEMVSVETSFKTNSRWKGNEDNVNGESSEAMETPEGFVNSGFHKWQMARDAWCGKDRKSQDVTTDGSSGESSVLRAAIPIDVDEVIDVLFDPRWRGGSSRNMNKNEPPPRFPQNVPLPQMIDVLTDLWEAEGLDV